MARRATSTLFHLLSKRSVSCSPMKLLPMSCSEMQANGINVVEPLMSVSSSNTNCAAKHGAHIITSGGLIATPTDTVYGIAGDAQNDEAISKIYEIKGRNSSKPIAICVSQIDQVYSWGKVQVPRSLLEDLLPGPVTLVFERQEVLNPGLNPTTNLIGIRIPDHQFIVKLAEFHGGPVALTSANFSNDPSTLAVEEFRTMWPSLQCVFDGGRLSSCEESEAAARAGSTVIDLSQQGHFRIIRNGTAYSQCVNLLEKKYKLKQLRGIAKMVSKTNASSSSSFYSSSKQGDLYHKMNDFVISRTPDQSQTTRFLHQLMRIAIATISQEIGWNSAHLSALDVLSDLTVRYLLQVAKQSKKYTEHYGRTLVSEDDIALGLKDMNISISGLEEYLQNFDSVHIPKECPYFPVPRKTDLNFLRPGTSEVVSRPVHVHEYMPPMIFEEEEKESDSSDEKSKLGITDIQIKQDPDGVDTELGDRRQENDINGHISIMGNGMLVLEEPSAVPEVGSELVVSDPITEVEVQTEITPEPVINNDLEESSDDDIEPTSSKVAAVFATFKSTKKLESASENAALRRVRKIFEEHGHPFREVTSVIMTSSGYLSEAREGRLPDTKPPPCLFEPVLPSTEKKKRIPTMKRILEGAKKVDNRHSDDDMEDETPRLFGVPDKITTSTSDKAVADNDIVGASSTTEHGGAFVEEAPHPKKLSKHEKKMLSQKEKKELKSIKKLKIKHEKLSLKKSSFRPGIDAIKELGSDTITTSKERKNKLTIFTKKQKWNSISSLTSKKLEKQKKKEKKFKIRELKIPITPLEEDPSLYGKTSMSSAVGATTEPIESDEDFTNVDTASGNLAAPPAHITSAIAHQSLTQESMPKKKLKKDSSKLKIPHQLQALDAKHQKKAFKQRGMISPTMLPPIPKLTKAKLGKLAKRPIGVTGISTMNEIPLKKKRGRPKKIWDTTMQTAGGMSVPLPPGQLATIGKSLMIKEPSLKLEPPLKIMKIRKEHMEPVQDLGPAFTTKPPSISPKAPVVSADLLKRLPAQPGLIPDVSPVPPMRFPKDLPPSISITPAAISPQKEATSTSRSFSGGLPPNVCSSVTITRIDMPHQQKLASPYDEPVSSSIGPGPPMLTEKRSKMKNVPPPPPLQIPIQTETESGITITPIMMGKSDRFDIPPPPPLTERPPQRGEKASMLAKLDEELSSKEQRKKDKEKRKELKKEKKKKAKDKDRAEKKDKEKSEKKKKKKEKSDSGEPPVAAIPKLTLKLSGHSNTPTPVDSPNPPQVFAGSDHDQGPPKKFTFKPMEEKKRTPSPDLHVARFSPLVTRPQKPARAAKAHAAAACAAVAMGASVNQQEIVSFPPVSRESNTGGGGGGGNRRGRGRPPKGGAIPPAASSSSASSVKGANKSSLTLLETETVGVMFDDQGNQIWICPACGRQDDGSPMIGCDSCDDWYHFTCVGITDAPKEEDSWFCQRCKRKQKSEGKQKKRK